MALHNADDGSPSCCSITVASQSFPYWPLTCLLPQHVRGAVQAAADTVLYIATAAPPVVAECFVNLHMHSTYLHSTNACDSNLPNQVHCCIDEAQHGSIS